VEASTINPSDRLRIGGHYFPVPLPATMGLEGTGRVVEANGAHLQDWVGKRVSFVQDGSGSWGEFATASPDKTFPLDEEVPLHSAASGIVNPLTVVGMTEIYEGTAGKRGIIHTAAASSLGRMLNKRCKSLGIPLLNIVRREEHAALLKAEGAEHVIVTKGNWEAEYAEAIKAHGFNVLFDALGGGPITESLILGLNGGSYAHIYGYLEGKPLSIAVGLNLSKGIYVTGYLLFTWYAGISEEKKQWIKENYSSWLKGDLATHSYKIIGYGQIEEGIELSASKGSEGKVTITP
jgi:NADPH:quinone reductase